MKPCIIDSIKQNEVREKRKKLHENTVIHSGGKIWLSLYIKNNKDEDTINIPSLDN